MRRQTIIFLVGMLVISLIGTLDLIQIPYPTLYKIPIYLRTVVLVLPIAILTFFLILYLLRNKLCRLSKTRLSLLIIIALAGILIISNIGSLFYYVGGAGYEYGAREIPAWIYALWGSIPTFLMFAAFYFSLIKFGMAPNRLSEDHS